MVNIRRNGNWYCSVSQLKVRTKQSHDGDVGFGWFPCHAVILAAFS